MSTVARLQVVFSFGTVKYRSNTEVIFLEQCFFGYVFHGIVRFHVPELQNSFRLLDL